MVAPGSTREEAQGASGSPLQIGQIVAGKYRIERQIGRGGMGIVLAATHLQLEHLVAIKVMRRDLIEDDKALNRLLVEARSAARIRSEHVARVLDVGTLESGSPFIVMEYLEGEDLADLLDRQGALDVEQAVTFMLQSCEALAEVHVAEMVHRDLKPGNLFIARLPDGSPTLKIVDFGISKHIGGPARERAATTSPQVLGSPFYMAPEQMRADAVDERSDIWALGAILFEMLTGRPPFIGETLPEVYAAVLNSTPPPIDSLRPGTPPGLDDVVQRCLEKDPAQRFCDVADLAEALAPFGSPTGAQSVERITRILTNPEPIRARYSTIPGAVPGSASSGGGTGKAAESALGGGVDLLTAAERKGSGGAWAEHAAVPLRVSLTHAELKPLSATGVGARSQESELRSRTGRAWLVVALAAALVGSFLWLRRLESPAPSAKPRVGTASSTAGVSTSTAPRASTASDMTGEAPPAAPREATRAKPRASVRAEKKALRAASKARPSISVSGFRAAVANKKKSVETSDVKASNLPAAESPPPKSDGSARELERLPVLPQAAPRTELQRSDDPWNPSSFGDRR